MYMKSNANKITKKHRIIFSLSMAIALTATATVGGVLGYALHKSKQNNPVTPPAPVDKKLIMTATNNNLEYDSYNTVSTIYATYTDSDESPASFTSNENIKLTIADTIYNNKYFQFHDNGDGSGVLTMTAGIPSVGSVKHVDIQAKDTAGLSSDYIIDLMPNKKNPEPIPTPQIALSNDNPTLQFDQQGDHESNILVSVNTGGTPTLTASGNDEGTY
ncbi:hypothetical protein FACS1894166_13430 [Bacilli bacterium]|nr:hypothetical protein FACS1894166_13430 [Bacilli bacterium]